MNLDIKVVFNGISRISPALRADLAGVIKAVAEQIHDDAVGLVPVDTGALRDSIEAEPIDRLHWAVSVGGGTRPDGQPIDYAEHVEYGTTKQAAQPYFTPAIDGAREPFRTKVMAAVARAVRAGSG